MLGWHDESDNVHEQGRHWIPVQHDGEDSLHGLDFCLIGAFLQLHTQIRHGRHVGRVVLVDQAVRILEKPGHVGRRNASRDLGRAQEIGMSRVTVDAQIRTNKGLRSTTIYSGERLQ